MQLVAGSDWLRLPGPTVRRAAYFSQEREIMFGLVSLGAATHHDPSADLQGCIGDTEPPEPINTRPLDGVGYRVRFNGQHDMRVGKRDAIECAFNGNNLFP